MGSVIGEILPLAIGIAISPIPIIAAILMLLSPKAKGTSIGFLLGWVVGIVVAVTVFTLLSSVIPAGDADASTPIRGVIQILLGAGLLLLALRQWRSRPKPGEEAVLPKWMSAIDTMNAGKGFGLGFLLAAVNPKNLLMGAGAGVAIGERGTLGRVDRRRDPRLHTDRSGIGRDPRDRLPGRVEAHGGAARVAAHLARAQQRDA